MPDPLRLGVAGLGMGAGRVIPEIAQLPFIRLTAGADVRTHALERFHDEFGAATLRGRPRTWRAARAAG